MLLLLLIAAALSKEFFAITVPLAIAFYLRARRSVAAAVLAVPPAFLLVRAWAVGGGADYGAPLLGAFEAARAALLLPYMLAGNSGGYLLVALAIALLGWLWWRKLISTAAVGCITVCAASAVGVLYPVAFPLRLSWHEHGTWYRAVFLLGSGLLLTFACLLSKLHSPAARHAVLACLALVIVPGGFVTQQKWHASMLRYKTEGQYYLTHPDRLLYCELPATWFLPGIDQMYEVQPHAVMAAAPRISPELRKFTTIWRYRAGEFVEDRSLFEQLLTDASAAD
jgi:hypothetical protein